MSVSYVEVAAYRLLKPFYVCHLKQLVAEGEEIEWDGEPNEMMEPLNEPARQRLQALVDRLDALPRPTRNREGDLGELVRLAMMNRPQYEAPLRSEAGPMDAGLEPETLAPPRRRRVEIGQRTVKDAPITTGTMEVPDDGGLKVREPVRRTRSRTTLISTGVRDLVPIDGSI